MHPVDQGSRCEAGKSPLLIACWREYRGPLVYDLRALGVSLWQPISYAEAELLVSEILTDRDSRLVKVIAAEPAPVNEEQQQATAETMDDYRRRYGL